MVMYEVMTKTVLMGGIHLEQPPISVTEVNTTIAVVVFGSGSLYAEEKIYTIVHGVQEAKSLRPDRGLA